MNKKIMRGFVVSMWALMAAAFVGCAKDVSEPSIKGEQAQVEVIPTFHNSTKGGTTRAVDGLDINSTGFSCLYDATASDAQSPDSKAKVMVDDGSSNYIPYAYRVTGSSVLTVEGDAPTFPSDVDAVNVYGWYPYTDDHSFTIQADQRTTTGYCLSDLMFANKVQCTRDANGVTPAPLAFRHAMSKVKIVLNPTAHVTVTDVKLMNVKPTVTIDDTDKGNLEVGAAEGEAGDVILLSGGSITSASAAADKTLAAVFPAQTIDAAFIQITAEIGGSPSTITYDFSGNAKTFEKGNEYTADITVSATETDDPTIDISDWENQEGFVYIAGRGVALADATVGMIIAENGKAYTPDYYRPSYGKKVAVVAYKGAAGTADTSDGSSGYHGLAIALKDANNGYTCRWCDKDLLNDGCSSAFTSSDLATVLGTSISFGAGLVNTYRLVNFPEPLGSDHSHPAAEAAADYKYDASVAAGAHPANTSQWFLPTMYQWNLMVKSMCGDHGNLSNSVNNYYKTDSFSAKITAAGGDPLQSAAYWSSVGYIGDVAWFVGFYFGNALGNNVTTENYVRPIIAF